MGVTHAIAETVCVAEPADAVERARFALGALQGVGDAEVRGVRGALLAGGPPPPIAARDVLRYLPPDPARGDGLTVRAAAAVDPARPDHGWLVVDAAAPLGRSDVPLHLHVLLDVSDSMSSSLPNRLPALQLDGPSPTGVYRGANRLDLARAVLSDLVDRLPTRAIVSLVVFDRAVGTVVLPPTPADDPVEIRFALRRATQELAHRGAPVDPLTVLDALTAEGFDPCADHRVLLVTDDNARLDVDPERVNTLVAGWAARGIELWTLSLHSEAVAAPIDAVTQAGQGVVVPAITRSEAVESIAAALRASGAVARRPTIAVAAAPGVELRPIGGSWSARDAWTLPDVLPSGWRDVALYEIRGADLSGELASVTATAESPAPGDWTQREVHHAAAGALADAPAYLRHRVFASAVAQALAEPSPAAWTRARALGVELVREPGPARELQAWVELGAGVPR